MLCALIVIVILVIMQAVCQSGQEDEEALRAIDLLYDAALISSGFTVSSPSRFLFLLTPCFLPTSVALCIMKSLCDLF